MQQMQQKRNKGYIAENPSVHKSRQKTQQRNNATKKIF